MISGVSQLHVEPAAIDHLIVKFFDSSLSCYDPSIMVFRIVEADEGILALGVCRVLLDADGLDKTVLAEHFMNLVLVPL